MKLNVDREKIDLMRARLQSSMPRVGMNSSIEAAARQLIREELNRLSNDEDATAGQLTAILLFAIENGVI